MLLTGEYEHTIDAKGRMAIPANLRAKLDPEKHGNGFYLVWGANGRLWLWPEKTFEDLADAIERSLLPDEDLMEFYEYTFPLARHLELDSAGRVRVPEDMLAEAELASPVMIIGMRDHLELRDPEAWRREREARRGKAAEIILRARKTLQERRRADEETRS